MLVRLLTLMIFGSALGGALLACTEPAKDQGPTSAVEAQKGSQDLAPWEEVAHNFIEQTLKLSPATAVSRGRHEYDGVQTDFSERAIKERIDHFKAAIDTAQRYTTLVDAQAYDRDLLLWYSRRALYSLEDVRSHQRNVNVYFSAISPDNYVSREYARPLVRLRALVKHTQGVANVLRQMRENLQTPLPSSHIALALSYFGGLIPFYEEDIPRIFDGVGDAALHGQLADATATAVHGFRESLVWLQAQEAAATDSFALGKELFEKRLQVVELTDLNVASFKAKGEADLQRNLESLRRSCDAIEEGIDLHVCVAQVDAVKPEGGAVAGAQSQLASLREFMLTADLVGIPSDDEARVAAAPPHRRNNSAYINLRGPYEGPEVPSTYYIAPPDPSWTPEEQAAYVPGEASLLFTSVHEVWPGHFLHGLYIAAAPTRMRQVMRSGGFMEGWAHYSEELMVEAGLGRDDPVIQVGQLTNALLRNVRYLCSVGMHVENMSMETCETMFREKGFQDPGNARQQAARGTYDPGYYSYTLQKLLIRELREDWTAARGGREAWRDFHEKLLALGGPPTDLARKYLVRSGP